MTVPLDTVNDIRSMDAAGRSRSEISLVSQQVIRCLRDLALVGAAAASPLGCARNEPLFTHDGTHGPFTDVLGATSLQGGENPSVAIGAIACLKGVDSILPGSCTLFRLAFGAGTPCVLVAALGHIECLQQLAELMPGPQALDHHCLLRVAQPVRVGALVFFYYLKRGLAHIKLELHASELFLFLAQHLSGLFKVIGQTVVFPAHGGTLLLFPVPVIIADGLPSPYARRVSGYSVIFGCLLSGGCVNAGR